jgi:hypothetical protein
VPAGPLFLAALLAAAQPLRASVRHPAPARPVGSVGGVVQYKGCPGSPAGAVVTVIGRDASARVDEKGRFGLALPPGSYSLIISGPGLVPDQRVDDVAVSANRARDLGTIEVWPEERPPGCVPGALPAPAPSAVVATAPDTPALDLPGDEVAPSAVSPDQIWLRGGAGSGKAQFGLQGDPARDDEDALGPPSFGIGPHGSLWVLDGLNARVQRFDRGGRYLGSFRIVRHGDEADVEADLAVSDDDHAFIFTQSDPGTLSEYRGSARLLVRGVLPPSLRGVDLIFAMKGRPVFLMTNGQAVRAELGWGGVRAAGPLPGLPMGDLFVRAERLDRWRATLELVTADGRVRRSVQLRSRVPIADVRLVGVNRRDEIVLAVDRSDGNDEATPRAEVLLLAVSLHGHLSGAVSVPPGGRRFEFREFAIDADGSVVQMQSDAREVRFVRWTLKPLPREVVAGEGLVRGRVLDAGRPAAAASVIVTKLKRKVETAADGTFELRLPAGTYHLVVRRPAVAGFLEAPPVDLRVAVAAGATIEVGDVSLAARLPPLRTIPLGGSGGGIPTAPRGLR